MPTINLFIANRITLGYEIGGYTEVLSGPLLMLYKCILNDSVWASDGYKSDRTEAFERGLSPLNKWHGSLELGVTQHQYAVLKTGSLYCKWIRHRI